MVGLTGTGNTATANAHDGGHQTDFLSFDLKSRPLLNMAFKIGQMATRIDPGAGLSGIAGFSQSVCE